MTARKNIHLFFLILATALACFVNAATAQEIKKRLKFSTTEDVAIAFYKTGGSMPNFERWIKERDPYKHTSAGRRPEVMAQEKARLKRAYNNFDPRVDQIIIRTIVDTKVNASQDEEENIKYNIDLQFSKAPEALYFPYDFIGERIVIMPNKLDLLMKSEIDQQQYIFLEDALRNAVQHTMIVRLVAKEADLSKPYKIDGLQQWVMKAEVVSLEVWNEAGSLLWEYTAPWYMSPDTMRLNNLYKKKPGFHTNSGGVKSLDQPQ